MLTLVGLSLIIANVYVPRARLAEITQLLRACVSASRTSVFFYHLQQIEKRFVGVKPSVGQGRFSFEFRLLHEATRGTRCVCLSHQHAAQPATPRSIQPQTPVRAYFQSRFTESTDGKTLALLVHQVAILDSHLVTVMRPICLRVLVAY